MKKNFFIIAALFFALGLSSRTFASGDGIILNPILVGDTLTGPIIGGFPHPHAPARPVVLPVVEQVGSALFFYPEEEGMLSFRIEDASRSIVCSDNIYLYTDEQNEYSLTSLPAGDYYLIIAIAGREYEGEFTIE